MASRLSRSAVLQGSAPYQTRKGRCSTLNCCMSLSLNRSRFKETRAVGRSYRHSDGARPRA
ncbi:hypothetical protein CO656_22070 [Sinorhizobium sp. FG01]|nr:hypothetical protein CO656_22070 [Sinorhizobium sp. FG01]PDT55361.1 hypothetical protein CO664_02650 [Sinorhizobium sp. NG07B]